MGEETLIDKIEQIRARHEVDTKIATVLLNQELSPTWTLAGWWAHDDRAWLLTEVERLTRERNEARAEVERLREALEDVLPYVDTCNSSHKEAQAKGYAALENGR